MEINDPCISIESICYWDVQAYGRCSILQLFREQMTEFYGKRGRSWHISAGRFLSSINYRTCTVIDKNQSPNIINAYLKSDNAVCYHNSQLLLALPDSLM